MGLKHYNGYYKALKAVRQEEYRKEDQQKEYRRREEEAYERLTKEFNSRDKED